MYAISVHVEAGILCLLCTDGFYKSSCVYSWPKKHISEIQIMKMMISHSLASHNLVISICTILMVSISLPLVMNWCSGYLIASNWCMFAEINKMPPLWVITLDVSFRFIKVSVNMHCNTDFWVCYQSAKFVVCSNITKVKYLKKMAEELAYANHYISRCLFLKIFPVAFDVFQCLPFPWAENQRLFTDSPSLLIATEAAHTCLTANLSSLCSFTADT